MLLGIWQTKKVIKKNNITNYNVVSKCFKNIFHCKFYLIHQIFVYIFIINVTICTLEIEKERVRARESYDNKKRRNNG